MADLLQVIAYVVGQMCRLGFECYVSQGIIDDSFRVGLAVYANYNRCIIVNKF